MTYSYSNRVTRVKLFGLVRLLMIWKASVYKLVMKELLLFCMLYAGASLIYRFGLKTDRQKKMFEKMVVYSGTFDGILPVTVTFVLGFYVSVVVQRWWSQFMHIPWPDRFMSYLSTLIPGCDEATTMIRRTIVRYLILAEVLLLMTVSAPIKKRFPTVESLVEQGLMSKKESEMYNAEDVPKLSTKFWIPTEWIAMLFGRAWRENRIKDSYSLTVLLNELSNYKTCLYTIFFYDWISLPLVYTQVTTVAVYGMYVNTIMSRQYINGTSVMEDHGSQVASKYSIDLYLPLDSLLQLFFYLGWLKVAEQMLNPMGGDDDDFECNFIIDRNLKVGLYVVDSMQRREPAIVKDVWWQNSDPQLGYTKAAAKFALDGWFGSTADLRIPQESLTHVNLPDIPEASTPHTGNDVDGVSIGVSSNDSEEEMCPTTKETSKKSRTSLERQVPPGSMSKIRDKHFPGRGSADSQPGSPETKESGGQPGFQFPNFHQHSSAPTASSSRNPHLIELGEAGKRLSSLAAKRGSLTPRHKDGDA